MRKLTSRFREWKNHFGDKYYIFGVHRSIDLRVGEVVQVNTPHEKYSGTYIVQESPKGDGCDRCKNCDLYMDWNDCVKWCESHDIPIGQKKGRCMIYHLNKRHYLTSSVCMLRPPSRYYRAIYAVFKKLDSIMEDL